MERRGRGADVEWGGWAEVYRRRGAEVESSGYADFENGRC